MGWVFYVYLRVLINFLIIEANISLRWSDGGYVSLLTFQSVVPIDFN